MSCTEPVPPSPGGAANASETTAVRGGLAEYVHRGNPCGIKFNSYAERYRYLRGKAKCDEIPFPCCTPTTLACDCEPS